MILNILVLLIYASIGGLLLLLPDVSDTGVFTQAMTTASHYISAMYITFPTICNTLLAIFAFDIAFEVAYLLYKAIYWVIRRFPTQS
jgi:hypothetical protein